MVFYLLVCINPISVHLSWKLSAGVLSNCLWVVYKPDIRIYFPWRFVGVFFMVSVGCSELFTSIYWFSWYKIPFNFFVQSFFCWFLTCVYHIYWINIRWSWKLSSGVLENFQWDVSKPYIRICFPCRFVEVCGKGAGFFISPSVVNIFIGFKSVPQVYYYWLQVNHLKVFLSFFVKCILRIVRGIDL